MNNIHEQKTQNSAFQSICMRLSKLLWRVLMHYSFQTKSNVWQCEKQTIIIMVLLYFVINKHINNVENVHGTAKSHCFTDSQLFYVWQSQKPLFHWNLLVLCYSQYIASMSLTYLHFSHNAAVPLPTFLFLLLVSWDSVTLTWEPANYRKMFRHGVVFMTFSSAVDSSLPYLHFWIGRMLVKRFCDNFCKCFLMISMKIWLLCKPLIYRKSQIPCKFCINNARPLSTSLNKLQCNLL